MALELRLDTPGLVAWLNHDKGRRQKLIHSKSSEERVYFYCLKRSAIEEELGISDATVED